MSYLYPKNSISSDEIDQFLDVYYQKETVFVGKGNITKEYFNYILSKKLYWIIQIGSLEHIVRHITNDFDDNLDVIHMVYFNN